ncbi:ATP-dependent metallopeptidase FtsH/Yme1/Tma family protein [Clostridiales bacterium COT073_COT-073]|nr:ATP-dependent metallopeptidase FtsH/Yme1/Tma family protein [Clostridiales bacterium COT073_COT-073]
MRGFGFYALLLVVLFVAAYFAQSAQTSVTEINYGQKELVADIEKGNVVEVVIYPMEQPPIGKAVVLFKDPTAPRAELNLANTGEFEKEMLGKNVNVYMGPVQKASQFWNIAPMVIILISMLFLLIFVMSQAQGGGGSKIMSFGRSRARKSTDKDKKVTFQQVAGLEEEKEDLKEVVEFLMNPQKFSELGARIPKGVLLVGPPGTGKTLLAKAVAGEAKVPFFSISGSDFVEMFVGVGASRVRDLFDEAKKNSPCIVFIDEIDAVGRRRGAGLGGGHDEREQTLNQLLVEMDGFGINEGVIIIAATNRVDILDPALLRPGRFDRQVMVGRPDVKGREEILKVHAKGKPLSDTVDLKEVARTTAGFTGADLENLLNEAAIFAARKGARIIDQDNLRQAFVKVGIGTEKRSRIISEKEKKITAYHEAGHAIIHQVLPNIDSVHSISIIPTGFAGGYTMPMPKKDEMYLTKSKMEQEIVALLGGRAAEALIIGDITTGASNDIERATKIARNMVVRYGMSDVIGPIQLGQDDDEVFIGRDWGHTRNYGENIAGLIDDEIKRIVTDAYQEAMDILEKYIDVLHATAELLIQKEKVYREEFIALFGDRLPKEEEEPEHTSLKEQTEALRREREENQSWSDMTNPPIS